MNYKVRLMLIVLVACAASVMLGDEVDAAEYDLELELNDTSSVKVVHEGHTVGFNWTLTNNGSAASELIIIDVIETPKNWSHPVLFTRNTTSPPDPHYPPCEVLVYKEEIIEVTLLALVPSNLSNDTYWFTLIAYPKADPTYNVTYDVGVIVPQEAGFHLELWNPPPGGEFKAIPPSTVTIRFALWNTGNGMDEFLIQGESSRNDAGWTLEYVSGVNEWGFSPNLTPDPYKRSPHFIDVKVPIPAGERAGITAQVTINATSMFNVSKQMPPAFASITSLQYFNFQVYINGPDKKEGIPGQEVEFQLKINNSGNGWDTFTIRPIWDVELNLGFIASADPRNLDIDRMTTGRIQYIVKVPESAPMKTYFFTAEVKSSSPELAPVTKSFVVEVGQYYGIELSCEDPRRITYPGGNPEFEVMVRNTGNGLDSFVITELEGAPLGWLTYTQPPEVTLLQDQEADINIIVITTRFEEAPKMNYTLTVRAESSRSDATATVDLFIDIRQYWRIEWMYQGEGLTNPARPKTPMGSVRPRPEIDLLNETSMTVVLGVRNYGNGPDEVTVKVDNGFDQVYIAVTPMIFTLGAAETQEVMVTIRVPKELNPGLYYFLLNATSSNEFVDVRSVPIDFLVLSVFTEEDFSDLEYNDIVDDDYLFTFTSDNPLGEVIESSGRHHRSSSVDIVNVKAVNDHKGGWVNVTLTCSGDIIEEVGTEYWVFFVNGSHKQPRALLKPWEHKIGSFIWTYSDQTMTYVAISFSYITVDSAYPFSGIRVDIEGNKITFSVLSRELRAAGVDTGSGFGVYAYAHTMTERENPDYRVRINWDAAGLGAARLPAEFFNEQEAESPTVPYLVPLVIGLVVIVALAVAAWRWRFMRGPQ